MQREDGMGLKRNYGWDQQHITVLHHSNTKHLLKAL